jgi:hypothetical protein
MTVPVSVVMLFAAGTTLIIASGLVLYSIISEVNRKLPEEQQIPYLFSVSYPYVSKAATIKREYGRFYPNDHPHAVRIVLNVLGFILMVACAAQLSHFWRWATVAANAGNLLARNNDSKSMRRGHGK